MFNQAQNILQGCITVHNYIQTDCHVGGYELCKEVNI